MVARLPTLTHPHMHKHKSLQNDNLLMPQGPPTHPPQHRRLRWQHPSGASGPLLLRDVHITASDLPYLRPPHFALSLSFTPAGPSLGLPRRSQTAVGHASVPPGELQRAVVKFRNLAKGTLRSVTCSISAEGGGGSGGVVYVGADKCVLGDVEPGEEAVHEVMSPAGDLVELGRMLCLKGLRRA